MTHPEALSLSILHQLTAGENHSWQTSCKGNQWGQLHSTNAGMDCRARLVPMCLYECWGVYVRCSLSFFPYLSVSSQAARKHTHATWMLAYASSWDEMSVWRSQWHRRRSEQHLRPTYLRSSRSSMARIVMVPMRIKPLKALREAWSVRSLPRSTRMACAMPSAQRWSLNLFLADGSWKRASIARLRVAMPMLFRPCPLCLHSSLFSYLWRMKHSLDHHA